MTLTVMNITVAAVAVCLMALVLRGTLWHVLARDRFGGIRSLATWEPGDWMRVGVGIYHVKSLVRITRWDLYAPSMRLSQDPDWVRSVDAVTWNTGFSLASIFGSLIVLYALYRNIPSSERWRYNMLTAPWWPGKPPISCPKR